MGLDQKSVFKEIFVAVCVNFKNILGNKFKRKMKTLPYHYENLTECVCLSFNNKAKVSK